MPKKLFYFRLIPFFLLFLNFRSVNAQEEKFKALFIYNFTKYINWPEKRGNFVITVVGNDAIISEIESIATKKTIGVTQIEVRSVRTASELENCHILYIPQGKSDILPDLIAKAKEKHILIISDKKDACLRGSCINFVSISGKISFEISRTNIESYGLQVSGDLINLGVGVNN